jgi:hypothetical protein
VEEWHFADDAGRYQDFPTLSIEEKKTFEALVRRWRARRQYEKYFSDQAIEDRLSRLIVDCLNEPDRTEEFVQIIAELMETTPKAQILLPLIGIEFQAGVDEYVLAPDARIIAMAPAQFEEIVVKGYVAGLKGAMPVYGDPEKLASALAESLRKCFENTLVLIITACGDENIASKRAQARADLVVDYLQYAAAIFNGPQWRVFVDWSGDVPASIWRNHGVIPLAGSVMPNNPGSRRGMLAPWKFTSETAEELDKRRASDVRDAVLAEPRADHQDMIRRAVRAFADGERQRSPDGKKLSYVTVFDIFFSVAGTETTKSIREGVAFTMYKRENVDERFEQAQFINRVYDSRSNTTHEFETGKFEPDDLKRLRLIALNFIRAMALREKPFTKTGLLEELKAERAAMGDAYERFKKLSRQCANDKSEPDTSALCG